MSLVDKSQPITNWDPSLDPNIPPWKRELIMMKQKRAGNRTPGVNTISEPKPSLGKPISVGSDALKGTVREKWHGNASHQAAVHPGKEYTTKLHASGSKHKDWDSPIPMVARSYVDSSVSSQKQRSIARPGADKALSGWQNDCENSGEREGRRFCVKHIHRMVEEKGESGKSTESDAQVVPSPTCSSFSDGFTYCDSDGDEYEYGPGIVDRLRSKFINLTVNEIEKEQQQQQQRSLAFVKPVRRVASLEQMLENDELGDRDVNMIKFSSRLETKAGSALKARKSDMMKKARSMETLTMDIDSVSHKKTLYYEKSKAGNILFNENVVIIEQPKRSHSIDFNGPLIIKRDLVRRSGTASIEEDELPKPDIVRTYKKIFEMNDTQQKGKVQHGKSAGVVPAYKNIVAKSDTSFSNKSIISAKSWMVEATASGLLKPVESTPETSSDAATTKSNEILNRHESVIIKEHSSQGVVCNGDVSSKADLSTKSSVRKKEKSEEGSQQRVQEQNNKVNVVGSNKTGTVAAKLNKSEQIAENEAISSLSNTTSSSSSSSSSTNNRPRIIDVKSKTDEKPVGLIKPLTVTAPSEQKENFINQVKTAMAKSNNSPKTTTVLNGTIEETTTTTSTTAGDGNNVVAATKTPSSLNKKASSKPAPDSNSVVFNFTGKSNVSANISNTQSSFSIQRPLVKIDTNTGKLVSNLFRGSDVSGIVLIPGMTTSVSSDYSDEDDFVDGAGDEPILPCGIVFEGENVIIGRSCMLEKRNKQLKIKFDDNSTSTYEYPSESLLMEEYAVNHDEDEEEEMEGLKDMTNTNTTADDAKSEKKDIPVAKELETSSSLTNNTALNVLGGLANYIPSKLSGSETFELGVSRPASFNPPSVARTEEPTSSSNDEDLMLKPADDDEVSSWSTSQASETDLLF